MFRALLLFALAAYTSAQNLPTISDGCANTLKTAAFNGDVASCLNPAALVSLISGNSSTSITPAVNDWLTGLCAAPACSNATITALVSNVTAGCSQELNTEGVSPDNTAQISELIQKYYPTVRSIACLKDGSSFCITNTLQAFEDSIQTSLSLDTILGLFLNPPASLSQNVTCNSCTKEAYNIIKKDIPQSASLLDESSLTETCGASFTDGTTPAGVTQSAVQGTAGSSNGDNNGNGASSLSSGAAMALAAVVSTAALMVWV